jgi:hypothetical protein
MSNIAIGISLYYVAAMLRVVLLARDIIYHEYVPECRA